MKRASRMSRMMVVVTTLAALVFPTALYAGMLDPGAPPPTSGGTMRTLEELKPAWDQIIPGAPRFVPALALDSSGTPQAYLDKETGLVWEKSPDAKTRNWQTAMDYCNKSKVGSRSGWRLPTVEELASLVDPNNVAPTLPAGHPFSNIQNDIYWSSSTWTGDTGNFAWLVDMGLYYIDTQAKSGPWYAWCVRSGQQGP